MKEITVYWKKGNARVRQLLLQCDCSGIVEWVATIGCIHEDGRSVLVQCPSCKKIAQMDDLPHEMETDFAENGWIKE